MTRRALSIALAFAFLAVCATNAGRALGQSNAKSIAGEVAAHFRAGQEATRAGEGARAIAEYREVLRLMPSLTAARVNLGLAYFMTGQYQQAAAELQTARQEQPHLVPADLFLGIIYQKLGFPEKAIPPLEEVLRQDSTNHEALQTLAASYLERDNYRDALQVYRKLFAASPDPVAGLYALGQNDLAMAKQLNREISQKFQGTPWAARLAGDELAEQRRWVDAAAEYRRALSLAAAIPGLHADLGDMLLRQGKLADAEPEYRAELRRDATSEQALLGLAAADLARGAANPALQNIAKIWRVFPPFLVHQTAFPPLRIEPGKLAALARRLESAPDSPAGEFLLASIYRTAGQSELATQQWSSFLSHVKAWNLAQKKAGIRAEQIGVACRAHRYAECARLIEAQIVRRAGQDVLLGKAFFALGDDPAAAGAFAEALSLDQARAPSRYWLLRSCQRLALASLKQMMERAPDSWRVHQIQGEYYQSRFDYKEAIEEFRRALSAQPGSAKLHEQLGMAFLLNKNPAEGKAEIEKALRLDPTRAHSLYLLGRMYFRRRDIPESIDYFERAVRFDPRFLAAHAALGRAYLHAGQPALAVPELEQAAPTDYNGDLHYLLSLAYRQLGKTARAAQALAVSEQLRKKSVAYHQDGVAAAEAELADQ